MLVKTYLLLCSFIREDVIMSTEAPRRVCVCFLGHEGARVRAVRGRTGAPGGAVGHVIDTPKAVVPRATIWHILVVEPEPDAFGSHICLNQLVHGDQTKEPKHRHAQPKNRWW